MRVLPILPVLCASALAQEEEKLVTAGDALDMPMCREMRDEVMPRIEAFTRMRFRQTVPLRIEPRAIWEARVRAGGALPANHTLAYYRPGLNDVTIVPWVIGGYQGGNPSKKTRAEWVEELEPTMIHELVHAIHHQNFFNEGRFFAASLKVSGLTPEELDKSTVQFLLGEGFPEFVALRTTKFPERMHRLPARRLDEPDAFLGRYKTNNRDPYRTILFGYGYVDGLNLCHHLFLKAGARGVRAVLYRPPPREVLFQPAVLATVDLEDPPDPDSILGFLSPELLKGRAIRLAVNPGRGRFFHSAVGAWIRTPGCLIGYTAQVKDARYAFFVGDPDRPGKWSALQLESLRELNPAGVTNKQVPLPLADGAQAQVVRVEKDGLYVRAEHSGLVVLAHEAKPTPNLERRVVLALRALYQKRPKRDLYKQALERVRQR